MRNVLEWLEANEANLPNKIAFADVNTSASYVDLARKARRAGTFIALSIPGEHAKTLKSIIQMMFLYFGLGPSAVAVILGVVFIQLVLALAVGVVMNAVAGFLLSLLLPLFLGRK